MLELWPSTEYSGAMFELSDFIWKGKENTILWVTSPLMIMIFFVVLKVTQKNLLTFFFCSIFVNLAKSLMMKTKANITVISVDFVGR